MKRRTRNTKNKHPKKRRRKGDVQSRVSKFAIFVNHAMVSPEESRNSSGQVQNNLDRNHRVANNHGDEDDLEIGIGGEDFSEGNEDMEDDFQSHDDSGGDNPNLQVELEEVEIEIPQEYHSFRSNDFDRLYLAIDDALCKEILFKKAKRKRMEDYIKQFPEEISVFLLFIVKKARCSKSLSDLINNENRMFFLEIKDCDVHIRPPFIPLFHPLFFKRLKRSLTFYELFWITKDNLTLSSLVGIHVDCLLFSDCEWKSFFKSDVCFSWPTYDDFFDFPILRMSNEEEESYDSSAKNFFISQILRYATSNLTKEDIEVNVRYEKCRWKKNVTFPSFENVLNSIQKRLGICMIPYCGECHKYFTIRYDFWRKKVFMKDGLPDTKCHSCSKEMFTKLKNGHYPKIAIPYFNHKNLEKCFMEIPQYRKLVISFSKSFITNPMKTKIFQCEQGKNFYYRVKNMISSNSFVNEKNLLVHPLIHSFDGVRLKNVSQEANYTTMKDLYELVGNKTSNPFFRVVCDQYTNKIVNHDLVNLIVVRDLQMHEFFSHEEFFHFNQLILSADDGKAANEMSGTNLAGKWRCPNGECFGRSVKTKNGGYSFLFDEYGERRSLLNTLTRDENGKLQKGYKKMPITVLLNETFCPYRNNLTDQFHAIPNTGEKVVYLTPSKIVNILDNNILKKSVNMNWTEMSRGITEIGPFKNKVMKGWKAMKFVQKIHAMKFYLFPCLSIIVPPDTLKDNEIKRIEYLLIFHQEFYHYMKEIDSWDGCSLVMEENLYKRAHSLTCLWKLLFQETFPISFHRLLEELVVSIKNNSNHPGTCEFESSYGTTKGGLGDITRSVSFIGFMKIYLRKWITYVITQIPKDNTTLRRFIRGQKNIITFEIGDENQHQSEENENHVVKCKYSDFEYLDQGIEIDDVKDEVKNFMEITSEDCSYVEHFRFRKKHRIFTKNYGNRRYIVRENFHVLFVNRQARECVGELISVVSVTKDGLEVESICEIREREIMGWVLERKYTFSGRNGIVNGISVKENSFGFFKNMKIVRKDLKEDSVFIPLDDIKKKVLILSCEDWKFEYGSFDSDTRSKIKVKQSSIYLCLEDFYDRRRGDCSILEM